MKALCASRSSDFSSLFRGAFYIIRIADSAIHGSFNSILEPLTPLAAEKKESKSVLTLFLKQQGLSKVVAARTINRSDIFTYHLVSRLHSARKSWNLTGGELTTPEIRNTLIPYLKSVLEEHGKFLVDLVQNFPNAPVKEKPAMPVSQPCSTLGSKKRKVFSRGSGPAGDLRPQHLYLIELGVDIEQINVITCRFPKFASCSLERKIKPLVEFLLNLGVPKSDIPKILIRYPSSCGICLSEYLIPAMIFLEDLGIDKKQWAKVTYRSPELFTRSRHKFQAVIKFLYELGLSTKGIGKVLTRFPKIMSCCGEDSLRLKAEYFQSLGTDVASFLPRSPDSLSLSIDGNLKPVTEFFLEMRFNVEEVGALILRFPVLCTVNLEESLKPKWEFFLTMDRSKSELVKFPLYFGCSLEKRIRPRYELVKESRAKMGLRRLLSLPGRDLERVLMKKKQKMLSDKVGWYI